mmetsp:Transcript_37886/g.62657  ORF Transcript_37886/g.62657 Transcript_37886/m.62657 type:complete len:248 (+) Transcript_37886:1203-1946(+)
MRASVGVISGRRATALPSLSMKLYICSVISSPPLRLYKASDSSTGASYSTKASFRAVSRKCAKSQFLMRISSGKKSRVPDGGSRLIEGLGSSIGGPAAEALCASFFAALSAFLASFFSCDFDLPTSPSTKSPPATTATCAAGAGSAGIVALGGLETVAAAADVGISSDGPNHTAISRVAASVLSETSTKFCALLNPKSPRMVPSAARIGSGSPASSFPLCTADVASHTMTTTGPSIKSATTAASALP